MTNSFYFKLPILDALTKEQAKPGETVEGVVFIQGLDDEYGKPLLFPFLRIRDANGEFYLKETDDPKSAGCPYPPPCKKKSAASCYEHGVE